MKYFTLCARFEYLVCILHSQHVSIQSSSIPRGQQPHVAPAPHWSKWAPQGSHLWPYQGLGIRTCINPASRNCRTHRGLRRRIELTHSTVYVQTLWQEPQLLWQQWPLSYTLTTYLFMMCFPTSVEPVNPIFRTSGWSESLWPINEPVEGSR